jgi:hypothetical protein
MRLKTISYIVVLILFICCFSQAFAQPTNKINDEAVWLYHPDKDKFTGSYEWWYMDAHLDNGYLVAIVFGVPCATSLEYYKYHSDLAKGIPVVPYKPKDYAQVGFSVTDEKGSSIFDATEQVALDKLKLPSKKNMLIKFNGCQLEMKKTGTLPTFTVKIDIKDKNGNVTKANLLFNALVPTVEAGRGRTFDAVIDGKHLYDKWVVMASAAKVKADIAITNKATGSTTRIKENGFGYHDKNWGNHFGNDTAKGWIWARIAEEDLTIVFAEVPNRYASLYPTYQPCIIVHNGNVLAATETLDYMKGPAAAARLAYPTESTITFKPESGVKGTLKFYDLKMIYEKGPYSRMSGSWALDITTKYGKLQRGGKKLLFEYTDFSAK